MSGKVFALIFLVIRDIRGHYRAEGGEEAGDSGDQGKGEDHRGLQMIVPGGQ